MATEKSVKKAEQLAAKLALESLSAQPD